MVLNWQPNANEIPRVDVWCTSAVRGQDLTSANEISQWSVSAMFLADVLEAAPSAQWLATRAAELLETWGMDPTASSTGITYVRVAGGVDTSVEVIAADAPKLIRATATVEVRVDQPLDIQWTNAPQNATPKTLQAPGNAAVTLGAATAYEGRTTALAVVAAPLAVAWAARTWAVGSSAALSVTLAGGTTTETQTMAEGVATFATAPAVGAVWTIVARDATDGFVSVMAVRWIAGA